MPTTTSTTTPTSSISSTSATTTTTSTHPTTASTTQKRTRKTHAKVRTGCQTCKIRRKKCDETKPSCMRCVGTGRVCDGYVPLPPVHSQILDLGAREFVLTGLVGEVIPSVGGGGGGGGGGKDVDGSYACGYQRSTGGTTNVENDFDAALDEDEELEDFILSYRRPTPSQSPTCSSATATLITSLDPLKRRRLAPGPATISRRIPMAPSQYTQISDLENHCFTFFRYSTGPCFASYFDSSLWRTYAVHAALAHPVVLSCAAAVGATHRRFGYGISREAFEYCAHADHLHKKALRQLAELKRRTTASGMDAHDQDAIMTSEMLLGLFDGFQGDYDLTVAHLNNALKYLLKRPMSLVHTESQYCDVEPKPNSFSQLFHRIHCRALQLFGTPINILVKWDDGRPLPPIPDTFASIDEARDFLFTEVDWIMRKSARVWQSFKEISEAQNLHVRRMMRWSVSYAETVRNMERSPREKRACMLMKLTRNAAYLLLYLTLFVQVDTRFSTMPRIDDEIEDDPMQDIGLTHATKKLEELMEQREKLNMNFARVKILVEGILEEDGIFDHDEPSLSVDSGIGPPRYTGNKKLPVPETSAKTRRMVFELTPKSPDDHGMWQMLGVYGVAEMISAVEEHAVIDAVRNIIPESIDPRWVDITCIMESRRILLRYCRPDDYGLGMMWTQEWWAF